MDEFLDNSLDKKRVLRLQRAHLAVTASAIAVGLTFAIALAGYLPYLVAMRYMAMVLTLVAIFYGVIRSGVNTKFPDPNLSVPQLVAAGLATTYPLFYANETRPAFIAIYIMAFMFGMFVLDKRRLIGVAVFYLGCYGITMWQASIANPDMVDFRRELFRFVFLSVLLTWFIGLGSYISGLHWKLKQANERLALALRDAESLARCDSLTGSFNRRRLMEQLNIEAKRAMRGGALSICVIDLDKFKRINDTFGHQVGDEVLKGFVDMATRLLRVTDLLARSGGEEFVIVLSQTDGAGAAVVANGLRHTLVDMHIASLPKEYRVTASIGVAEYRPGEPIDDLLSRGDRALYQAKHEGRDRVIIAVD